MKKLIRILMLLDPAGRKLADDNIGAFSAMAAFFLFVSLFPFIMLLLALLQFFPFDMEDLIEAVSVVLPDGLEGFIVPTISEIYQKGTPALISLTAITAVWSASTGVNAILRGLTRIADSENGVWLLVRLKSVFYMILMLLTIILSLGLFVFGNLIINQAARFMPHLQILSLLASGFRWLCGVCLLAFLFDLVYLFAPKRKSRFLSELPGAVLAAAGWAGFSFLYSFYINNITNFSVYGSLTLAVFFLLWMYVCFYILFLGAEFNRFLADKHSRKQLAEIRKVLKE